MTTLLLRLFVKKHRDTEDPAVRSAIGKLAGATGIVCNILLFLGKLLAGLLVGSVSIVADALNNLSDAASSAVTLLGFRLAQRPADADHPYGHARYEYLSALAVAALILLIGAELIQSSIGKILNPQPIAFSVVTLSILIGSIGLKLWMAGFFSRLGKAIHSSVLQASSLDSRNDCIATAGVLLGCLISKFFGITLDGWMGLAVAIFVFWSGIQTVRETVSPLLGKRADPSLVRKLSELVLSHDKILGIHDLLMHDYGPGQCFASVHAELSAEEDPLVCHDIIDDIECDALTELNVHLVIHYDPVLVNDSEWNEMRTAVSQIVQNIHPALSVHDFRMVRGARQTKLVFDLAIPYSLHLSPREIKETIDRALAASGSVYSTVIRFDRNP